MSVAGVKPLMQSLAHCLCIQGDGRTSYARVCCWICPCLASAAWLQFIELATHGLCQGKRAWEVKRGVGGEGN